MRQAPRSPLSFKLQRVANVPEHPLPSTRLMSCTHIANRQLSRIIGASLFTINSQIPWLATVTGRVGVTAAPTVLVYAKGGGAWVRDNYTLAAVGGSTLANANTTQSGWTAGGGIEWAFAGNWTAFAEYNYFDFGTPGVMFTSADGVTTFPINIKQNINSFMVGINYRFGATGY